MVDINLKIEHADVEKKEFFQREVLVLAVVFVLLVIAYAGLLIYRTNLDKKTAAAAELYVSKLEAFRAGPAKKVFDFQNRLNAANDLVAKKDRSLEILQKFEEIIMPSVYIDSYSFEKEKNQLTLDLVAKNYNDIAKQILSFKNSGYFSGVSVSTSAPAPPDGVRFPVILIIK